MKYPALKMIFLFTFLASTSTWAAAIVKVEYKVDDQLVGKMIYTGKGGWDNLKYWKLLESPPDAVYDLAITPDQADGTVATLKGKVSVTMQARNSVDIGTANTESLTLKRTDKDSDRWHLSKEEVTRLAKLAGIE